MTLVMDIRQRRTNNNIFGFYTLTAADLVQVPTDGKQHIN